MNYFLAKTEPSDYSIDDLSKEKATRWDGIKNPQAVRTMKEMRTGDRVFLYHSGGISAIVGLAEVRSEAQPDPRNPGSVTVELGYLSHLAPPTPLQEVKASGLFSDWALVRQPRLSTMPAPLSFVEWMRERHPDVEI